AYNRIHEHYDTFWLKEAGGPIEHLVERTPLTGNERVLEAGCGTGFATALLAERLRPSGVVTAVDLSEGMLSEARRRTRSTGISNVRFVAGDALNVLDAEGAFDVVFSSWVLGYIPLKPFFATASRALAQDGRLAFVVHKENSPREPLDIFWEIVARDPSVLEKRVAFDFPRDMDHVREEIETAELRVETLWDGDITFQYDSAEEVLEHLLKSGAGTAFYDAVDPARRDELEQEFIRLLTARHGSHEPYEVVHDYVSCIAARS
ncbi:MAG: methyltransferase domain-containing protein, partial [bacterium]|nr:methyltransferase domain-containing protein [bacterium]